MAISSILKKRKEIMRLQKKELLKKSIGETQENTISKKNEDTFVLSPQLIKEIEKARKEIEEGKGIVYPDEWYNEE